MVKQTQTIRGLLPMNCLSVFDLFVGLTFKGLKKFLLREDYSCKWTTDFLARGNHFFLHFSEIPTSDFFSSNGEVLKDFLASGNHFLLFRVFSS